MAGETIERAKVSDRILEQHLTVAAISDAELLRRAVCGARARRGRGYHPRWTAVMDALSLGSTFAHQLCRRFGLDPDEKVRR